MIIIIIIIIIINTFDRPKQNNLVATGSLPKTTK